MKYPILAAGVFCALMLTNCKLTSDNSDIKSGLGGSPSQWSCNELKTEYRSKLSLYHQSLEQFSASYQALASDDSSPQDTSNSSSATDTNNTPEPSAADFDSSTSDQTFNLDDNPSTHLGVGNESARPFPVGLDKIKSSLVAECDDHFGRYGQDASTQILEQCRRAVTLANLLKDIRTEYNYGRNGECRSGRAATQTGQTSIKYPYCDNPCRFGQTNCVKCTFNYGAISSHYLCGEEDDTRNAIDVHCREGDYSCSGASAQCSEPQIYNDFASGTTSDRTSNTSVKVEVEFSRKLSAEWTEGVSVKAHKATVIKADITGNLQLKNARGAPILSVNGGETASTYSCSVSVSGAIVRSVGAEVGAGFDVVVAKGSATAGVGASFSALTSYATKSRDIPAGGQPLNNMIEGCRRFALAWGQNDLPDLVTENVVVKAVASRFMGETRDVFSKDILSRKIFCDTDVGATFSSGTKRFRITNIHVGLIANAISVKVDYDGSINGFDRSSITTNWKEGSFSQYADFRRKIFNDGPDGLSTADMRSLIRGSWLNDDHKFTNCSKTDY